MALLQIAEPGKSAQPHQRKLAIGIDLGTTNSLVASVLSGNAKTLPDLAGNHLLPSVVRYLADGQTEVGLAARQNSKIDAANTIASVKRLMGRGLEDVQCIGSQLPYDFVATDHGMPDIKTVAGNKSPVEVSAEILKTLLKRGEETLGDDISGAVITVPAYFDDAQRQATKDAAKVAGINVLRLLNEPTAAAVAYGLDEDAEGIHAVYDLGGGTFDISILSLNKGVFEVLATGGDSALGGDDFDHAVVDWILQQAGIENFSDSDHQSARILLNAACAAKEELTDAPEAKIDIALEERSWSGILTREKFNELVDPLIKKTIRACKKSLRDANVTTDQLKEVVMVGGSTRVLRVREKVAEWLGKDPLVSIDPDKVVAIGAALQADVLAGNKPDGEMLLLDVIPLSLGLETMGGLAEKVIHRNTTIPVAKAQEFTTFKDGQTAMMIHVVQGERELVSDCRSLAKFTLAGIPPMAAGAAKIRVTFQVDADGLLSVAAREMETGVESSIQVKPSYGLSDTEITDMLQQSFKYAEQDRDARSLQEQVVEADRMIEALTVALSADAERLLSAEEIKVLEDKLKLLAELKAGTDADAIEKAITDLNEASTEFASRRMDQSIQAALSGKSVDDIE